MATVIEIEPIVKSIELAREANDAFRLFTSEIGAWWPLETHTRAASAKGERSVGVTVVPRIGGRVYETLQNGTERDWGEVLVYEAGRRFAMSWQLGRERAASGEVTLSFEPLGEGRCRVTLTHAGWERVENGAAMRENYDGGWDLVFGERFAQYASR